MSNSPTPHEQYLQQRAAARYARAQQGRTTALDRAEERHEAISSFVDAMRFLGGPVIVSAAALVFPALRDQLLGLLVWWVCVWAAAAITSGVVHGLIGAFFSSVGFWLQNLLLSAGCLLAVGLGIKSSVPGVAIGAAILAAWPFVWLSWARAWLSGTAYMRTMRDGADEGVPRIIE